MEVRIGVRQVAREVTLESSQTPEEVQQTVDSALASGQGTLTLEDEKGRRVIVPVDAVGYVEIGSPSQPKVGFGSR